MADKHQQKQRNENTQVDERSEGPREDNPPRDVKELFRWTSPSRVFKKRNKKFYINLGIMLFIIALIAIFLQEFFALAALMAVFFYFYIAGTVEPITIDHRITNRGITTADHTYDWGDLTDFWFSEKYDDTILQVATKKRYPSRLVMLLPYKDKEKVKKILIDYISFQEKAPVTWADNLIEWFDSKLPASMR